MNDSAQRTEHGLAFKSIKLPLFNSWNLSSIAVPALALHLHGKRLFLLGGKEESDSMSAYKFSNYNHYLAYQKERRYLIYNTISNGLAELEPQVFQTIREGAEGLEKLENDSANFDLLQKLRSGNFIVEKDFDELAFIRAKLNMSRFGTTNLSLTIVPTQYCNLDCIYCYEGAKIGNYMNEETKEAVVEFVASQLDRFGYKAINVSWFGGEPLMHPEAVFSLSRKLIQLCRKRRVSYSAMIVTNGTNLNRSLVRRLKSCKVGYMQVTIDGPKDVHDVRRPYKQDVRETGRSSFDKIVQNIERVLGLLPITIRINVDKTNQEESLDLVQWMTARGWLEPQNECSFYIGYTKVWTSVCSKVAGQCFTMDEFSRAEMDFQKKLIERGFSLGNLYPSNCSYCMAASPAGFAIDPGGELYKCWADVGNKNAYLGNVRKNVEINSELLSWISYDPLLEYRECRKCSYFPICAGGCPYTAIKLKKNSDRAFNCTPWKTLMRKKMDLFLAQRARDQDLVELAS